MMNNVDQEQPLNDEPVQAQVVAATPIVIPVPVEREVITDEMRKAYSYAYTIKWVSGIDMFFALLYSFYNWYFLFFVLCSSAGYYGAKKFKMNLLYFYLTYEFICVFVKLGFVLDMLSNEINGYGLIMSVLSIIIGIWVSELTFKLILCIRKMTDDQLNLLRRIGYKPRAIVYI